MTKAISTLRAALPERNDLFAGGALLLAGLILRFRQLGCFEFKDDQARSVLNGLCALRDGFMVFAGQPGSTGIPNPAGGTVLCGVIALFGTSPIVFAAAFTVLSVLTAVGVHWAMKDLIGVPRAWTCAVLAAVSPVLVWNASNLWGPGLLIFPAAVYLRELALYIDGKSPRGLVWAGLAAALGAWIFHLSAFFLFPGMICAVLRRRPNWRDFAALVGIGAVLFGPWLYALVFQWDHTTSSLPVTWSERIGAWFWNLAATGDGLFFFEYFPREEWPVGMAVLAGLSAALFLLPVALGCRRLRETGTADRMALLLAGSIPLLYLALGLRIHPHYLMVIMLPVFVLASRGYEKMPRAFARGLLAATGVLLLGITLFWQNKVLAGNGHWREFGPSGNYLEAIAAELDGPTVWSLKVVAADERAKTKLDPISTVYIFDRHMQKGGAPKLLILRWDGETGRFRHEILPPMR